MNIDGEREVHACEAGASNKEFVLGDGCTQRCGGESSISIHFLRHWYLVKPTVYILSPRVTCKSVCTNFLRHWYHVKPSVYIHKSWCCYMKFNDNTDGSLTIKLSRGRWFVLFVFSMVAICQASKFSFW